MVVTNPTQRGLFEKLLMLARGDMSLVEAAIRENPGTEGKPADLAKIVSYIRKNRDKTQTQKVA